MDMLARLTVVSTTNRMSDSGSVPQGDHDFVDIKITYETQHLASFINSSLKGTFPKNHNTIPESTPSFQKSAYWDFRLSLFGRFKHAERPQAARIDHAHVLS